MSEGFSLHNFDQGLPFLDTLCREFRSGFGADIPCGMYRPCRDKQDIANPENDRWLTIPLLVSLTEDTPTRFLLSTT